MEAEGQKTYILQHFTGNGVMEDPLAPAEIIGYFDTYEEAKEEGERLHPTRDWMAWSGHTYRIHANPLTEEGAMIKASQDLEMKKRSDALHEDMRLHPERYKTTKMGDTTYIFPAADGMWSDDGYFGDKTTTKIIKLDIPKS